MPNRLRRDRGLVMRSPIAVLAVVVLVLVLFLPLLLPWLLGFRIEQLYRAAVDELINAGYRVTRDDYRRDWFQSRALLVIGPPTSGEAQPARLQIATRMDHGPGGGSPWRWPPVLAVARARATVIDAPRRLPPLLIDSTFELGGALAIELRLPDIAYSGNVGNLHLVNGQGKLRLFDGQTGWHGQGELGLLEAIDTNGKRLMFEGLGWRLRLRDLPEHASQGALEFRLDSLHLDATARRPSLELAGLSLDVTTAIDASQASAEATLRIERLSIDHANFAPSQLQLVASGIDAPALTALLDAQRQLGARNLPESLRGLALGELLSKSLPDLASADPRLTLQRLELRTPNGMLNASGHVQLSGAAGAVAEPSAFWSRRLSGEAQISLPQALVLQLLIDAQRRRIQRELRYRGEPAEPLPSGLEEEVMAAAQASLLGLLGDGWLEAERGRLSVAITLGEGLLTLNGKSLSIDAWAPP
ncbi:MAG: YdgA family protein [Thiohalocapsa sp. PB-PSB1]|jgi:hypothetical protein|nr:MAG: YdgA family protein [Thiohalocapsa sp. PB-PSB1]